MAKLANFIYCISADRVPANDGKGVSINAMGVMTALTPEFLPGTFTFSVIFSVLDIDVSVDNSIRIVFSKDGEEADLVNTGIIMLPPMPEPDEVELPKEYKGVYMSMDFRNVVFETEGLYNTTVFFNSQLIGSSPIYVKGKR